MNIKHKSTLEKFEKYLNLKGYSQRTIDMYIHYTKKYSCFK